MPSRQCLVDATSHDAFRRLSTDLAADWGRNVRRRREGLKLSQEKLARLIDLPVSTLSRIENGHLTPRLYLRMALAFGLACEIEALFPTPTRAEIARRAA